MMCGRYAAQALAFAGCLALFAAQAQTRPPIDAFGNLPASSAPRLSPDGKHIAMLEPYKGNMIAAILETHADANSKPVFISGGDGILSGVVWAKNDRLILISRQSMNTRYYDRATTWVRAFSVGLDGKQGVVLLKNMPTLFNNTNSAYIVDVDVDDPDHILMTLYDQINHTNEAFDTRLNKEREADFRLDLLKVDVHSGDGEILVQGNSETKDWMTDGHGNPIARIDEFPHPLKDHLIVNTAGSWKEVASFDATADNGIGLVGFTEDEKSFVRFERNDQSLLGLVRFDVSNHTETPLFYTPGYDIDSAITDEWTNHVTGASYVDDKIEDLYFNPTHQALQNGLQQAFPGMAVQIVSWDRARDAVIFAVEGARLPKTYYLLDRTTHQTMTITSQYPTLQESDLGIVKPYNYVARDGLPIPAYLTLPPGKSPSNLPVVVMPHGGPDDRDSMRFDWMAQFLANRGYAVLQPNFRGSSGYGHKFTEAGLKQWGLKIQDDISDGTKKLIADGIADPKRICIVGASFGGYAALAGATFSPDLYACAASWAGVSDLPVAIHSEVTDYGTKSRVASFWASRIGFDDMDKLDATSPSKHADQVKCPILLMHGEGDTTVRIEQSQIEYDALTQAHKKVEFVRFSGEDHYMAVADTRIRVLTELEKFLSANIGN